MNTKIKKGIGMILSLIAIISSIYTAVSHTNLILTIILLIIAGVYNLYLLVHQ